MLRRVSLWVTSIEYIFTQNKYNSPGEGPLYDNSNFFIPGSTQVFYDASFTEAPFSSTNHVTGFTDKVQTCSPSTSVPSINIYHCSCLSAKRPLSRRGLQMRRGCWAKLVDPWLITLLVVMGWDSSICLSQLFLPFCPIFRASVMLDWQSQQQGREKGLRHSS